MQHSVDCLKLAHNNWAVAHFILRFSLAGPFCLCTLNHDPFSIRNCASVAPGLSLLKLVGTHGFIVAGKLA